MEGLAVPKTMKILLVVVGVLFVGLFIIKKNNPSPPRISPEWSEIWQFKGIATSPDPKTGKLPDEDTAMIYERNFHTVSDPDRPDLSLEDLAIFGGKVITRMTWNKGTVDFQTGAHLQKSYQGDYYRFPRNVEKQTYSLRYSYLKGIPVSFEKEEIIEGLQTLLFSYKGRGEWTDLYAGTEDFPGIPVPPGHEIKCAEDQFEYKVWVEPRTGGIIKVQEGCYTGDYLYNIASGEKVAPIARWGGTTTEQTIKKQVARVQKLLEK